MAQDLLFHHNIAVFVPVHRAVDLLGNVLSIGLSL